VGDVGRPDLLERAAHQLGTMEKGAHTLFGSLARFRAGHAEHLMLWPGHGAGSACGKNLGGLPVTTLAYERLTNWGMRCANEAEFVREVLTGQPEPPAYFQHMKRMNQLGPPLLGGFRVPPRLEDAGIVEAVERGEAVVDVRPTREVMAGAIPGVLGIPVGGSFPTWAGSLLPYDRPVTLLAPDPASALAAVRQLAQVGLDHVTGWFGTGALAVWARERGPLAVTPGIAPDAAFARAQRGEIALLDVRGRAEHADGHVPGALHIPLGELAARARELPRGRPLALYCSGGTRSRIGVSVLRRAGFTELMDLGEGFVAHVDAGLPVE
jgi:hydroxyacylglutathione hydrolase